MMNEQPPVDQSTIQSTPPPVPRTAVDDAHDFIRSIERRRAGDAARQSQAIARRDGFGTDPSTHSERIRTVENTLSTLHGRDVAVHGNLISKRDAPVAPASAKMRVLGGVAGVPTYLIISATIDGTP